MTDPVSRAAPFVAAALWAVGPGCSPSASPEHPNLLLITVDTLRADRLGCYGAPADPSPRIDTLATQGVLLEAAATSLPRTTQALASLLTGRHPDEHGVLEIGEYLTLETVTLAEHLEAAGYHTAAVSANTLASSFQGLHQGFDEFVDANELQHRYDSQGGSGGFHAATVTDVALELLERHGATSPWFLWVHYLDPHFPYDAPDPDPGPDVETARAFYEEIKTLEPKTAAVHFDLAGRSSAVRDTMDRLYDAEVRYTDRQIGRLLDTWRARPAAPPTLLVFTSDHGESLGEHGYFYEHGDFVFEPSVRIPMIFHAPWRLPAARRVVDPVSIVDVVPTICELLELPALPGATGIDISELLAGCPQADPRGPVFCQSGSALRPHNPIRAFAGRRRGEGPGKPAFLSARDGDWVLVRRTSSGRTLLHNAASDPTFRIDLAAEHPERTERLAAALETHGGVLRDRWLMVRDGDWKLQRIPTLEGYQDRLYDLAADPTETVDLAFRHPDLAARLATELDRHQSQAPEPAPAHYRGAAEEAEIDRRLRSLGYIE